MRISSSPPVSRRYYETTDYPNKPPRHNEAWTSYVPFRLERSDVQKTIPSPTGFRLPTAYKASKVETEPTELSASGPMYGIPTYYVDYLTSSWGRPRPALISYSSSIESELHYRALSSVKGQTVNAAVALAELGKTIDMVDSRARTIANALYLAARRDWSGVAKQLGVKKARLKNEKNVASSWLEYIYGWLPLLSDVYGSVEEYNKGTLSHGQRLVARAEKSSSDTVQTLKTGIYRWGALGRYNARSTYHRSHLQKVVMHFDVDMPSLQRAARTGLTNPALVAWELVPLSFVADWFLPVGDWLSSIDATVGLTYLGGSHTYRATSSLVDCVCDGGTAAVITTSGGHDEVFTFERKVLGLKPDPFFVKNPFSTTRAISALALLKQRQKAF